MKNNIFEDLARVSTSVASVVFESAKNVQDKVKDKTQSVAKSAELVSRDEFEVLKIMTTKVRTENEAIFRDINELKQQLQTITTSLDIIKEQASKNKSVNTGGADDTKTLAELQKISGHIDEKLSNFEAMLSAQSIRINDVEGKVVEKAATPKTLKKPAALAVAAPLVLDEVDNHNLFGNE